MKIFGLAGRSGNVTTSLLARIMPELTREDHRVSTIKHAHHSFDADQPGRGSYSHRQAGAYEVMVLPQNRWALMHEYRRPAEPAFVQAVARMAEGAS